MRRTAHGFTLAEMLITLAVAGIIAGIGAPTYRALAARSKASAASAEITAALASARMAAISGRGTTVCPSSDGHACTQDTDWTGGWLVFRGRSTDRTPADDADLIDVHGPLEPQVRVVSSAGRVRVHYFPTGWASGTNVTLSICVGGERLSKVVMNNAGRVRSERVSDPCPSP